MGKIVWTESTDFARGLEHLGWTDPGVGAEPTPTTLDPVVELMTSATFEEAPSPADPTPPMDHFGRFAGLFCVLALGAGFATWHVI